MSSAVPHVRTGQQGEESTIPAHMDLPLQYKGWKRQVGASQENGILVKSTKRQTM